MLMVRSFAVRGSNYGFLDARIGVRAIGRMKLDFGSIH